MDRQSLRQKKCPVDSSAHSLLSHEDALLGKSSEKIPLKAISLWRRHPKPWSLAKEGRERPLLEVSLQLPNKTSASDNTLQYVRILSYGVSISKSNHMNVRAMLQYNTMRYIVLSYISSSHSAWA
eukprot:scaffold270_cov207-Alexandrium_tamarense.AAC.10